MVYPNPSNGFIYVYIPNQKITDIKVYDIAGKNIYAKSGTGRLAMNLSDQHAGIYFLQLIQDLHSEVFRLIIK